VICLSPLSDYQKAVDWTTEADSSQARYNLQTPSAGWKFPVCKYFGITVNAGVKVEYLVILINTHALSNKGTENIWKVWGPLYSNMEMQCTRVIDPPSRYKSRNPQEHVKNVLYYMLAVVGGHNNNCQWIKVISALNELTPGQIDAWSNLNQKKINYTLNVYENLDWQDNIIYCFWQQNAGLQTYKHTYKTHELNKYILVFHSIANEWMFKTFILHRN